MESKNVFRQKLSEIASQLDVEKFTRLKYLCVDHIPDGDREKINTAEKLFLELEQRTVIAPNDLRFLIDCLEKVGRKDLADDLKNYGRRVAEGKLNEEESGKTKRWNQVWLHKLKDLPRVSQMVGCN